MHATLRRTSIAVAAATALATAAAFVIADLADASPATSYHFQTFNSGADRTFNQLLGINDDDVIAGYFGSGAQGHPNKGYELWTPNTYRTENYPRSVQTQVTGLNNEAVTVGFWSTMNTSSMTNNNFGFYSLNGSYHNVNFPTHNNASPQADQLLGVNNLDIAVGFYTNAQGRSRGYEYNIHTRQFTRVFPPGWTNSTSLQSPSLTATAINDQGDVAGFYNKTSSQVDAFLHMADGEFITLAVHGAAMTQAFGINDNNEVVGAYTVGTGNNAQTHGFVWTPSQGFTTVDDPHGIGATTINGVNNHGDLVGFYTDSAGNTDGMLAQP
jgi:hypothetical protein